MRILFASIYVSVFCVVSYILNKLYRKKKRINENIIHVKARIMAKTELNDEFAKLYDVVRLYEDPVLLPRYDFIVLPALDIGEDIDEFWEKYEAAEKKYKNHPRYKIYKLFLNNVVMNGKIDDQLDKICLEIDKYYIPDITPEYLSSGTYMYNLYGGGGGGGGSYMYYNREDYDRVGQLKCPGFEKMRKIWYNVIEDSKKVVFVIDQTEIEDFYSMCELISGEELIC
jgi:hypothetical protein